MLMSTYQVIYKYSLLYVSTLLSMTIEHKCCISDTIVRYDYTECCLMLTLYINHVKTWIIPGIDCIDTM